LKNFQKFPEKWPTKLTLVWMRSLRLTRPGRPRAVSEAGAEVDEVDEEVLEARPLGGPGVVAGVQRRSSRDRPGTGAGVEVGAEAEEGGGWSVLELEAGGLAWPLRVPAS